MRAHPYASLPPSAHWRSAIADRPEEEIDPVVDVPWLIGQTDRIVTAGSCFAQHIAGRLRLGGFNHFVTETAPPALADKAELYHYGVYSARYGNIYTPRQLVQLVRRATGKFTPAEDVWREKNGSFIDPFRPQIQPGGFASIEEYYADREAHFAAVRKALAELDVMIFTLGLTEAWRSKIDGAVFPLCPGVAGGEFDSKSHEFHDFSVREIIDDTCAFIDLLINKNPKARLILTVSPVPLVATASGRHVMEATTYSKSVLRVACDEIVKRRPCAVYFPSYEIITAPFMRGKYFAQDCRSVTEGGVDHVMAVFMRHFTDDGTVAPGAAEDDAHLRGLQLLAQIARQQRLPGLR